MPVSQRGKIGGELKELEGFRRRGRGAFDAGKPSPSRDAGIAPQEMGGGSLVVLLLAKRAASEGPPSTRALEDQPGRPLKMQTSKLGRTIQIAVLLRRPQSGLTRVPFQRGKDER